MIVTIDGPAGAGKSSAARRLANRLGFDFLDTGAMYRAVAWAACETNISFEDPRQIEALAERITIDFNGDQVLVDGRDVTTEIRTPAVTERIRYAASNERVRETLSERQRQIGARSKNLVTEGRDQGTIVFPQADCKIFLTATAEERAKRRFHELIAKGENVTFPEVLKSQNQRDAGDANRSIGPLAKAEDAIEVYTDGMSPDEVLDHLEWIVRTAKK